MEILAYTSLSLLFIVVILHTQNHLCSCFILLPPRTNNNYHHHHHNYCRLSSSHIYHSQTKCSSNNHEHNNPNIEYDTSIQVFDNAFSSFACEELCYLADDHSNRGNDGSSVFIRPHQQQPHDKSINHNPTSKTTSTTLTPIERAIDSFLTSIGDTTSKVEYWSREEYININAHADIDEEQLEDDNTIRCPQMGHVLYLQVKDDLRGPTCVFPTKQKGWGNLKQPQGKKKKQQQNSDIEKEEEQELVDLVIVPAIQGRVLRFPGNAMHSVPCPANKWLSPINEKDDGDNDDDDRDDLKDEEKLEMGFVDSFKEEFDEFGDEYNDEFDNDDEVERSVLLFNTWPDDEPGPKGVNGDYMTGSLPEGIEISEEDALSFFQTEEAQRLAEWEEEYGQDAERIWCNEPNQWQNVQIKRVEHKNDNREENGDIRIGLMGNINRRLHEDKFVTLSGPTNLLEKALIDERQPTLFQLQNSNNQNNN